MANIDLDFNKFFLEYKSSWNECNVSKLSSMFSKDLISCVAYPTNKILTWGFQEACEGWQRAFDYFKGQNPKWIFNDVHITPISENEVVAIFWVSHSANNKISEKLCLYVETFRKLPEGWKLIRTFSESSLTSSYIKK